MSEMAEFVKLLEQEQQSEDEAERGRVDGAVKTVQEKLRAEFREIGEPCINQLRAIASGKDARAAVALRGIDPGGLVARGGRPIVVYDLQNALSKYFEEMNAAMSILELIPRRIAGLTIEDIQPNRYRELPNAAQLLSKQIADSPKLVAEAQQRLEAVRCLVAKLAQAPKAKAELWHPDLRGSSGPRAGSPRIADHGIVNAKKARNRPRCA